MQIHLRFAAKQAIPRLHNLYTSRAQATALPVLGEVDVARLRLIGAVGEVVQVVEHCDVGGV